MREQEGESELTFVDDYEVSDIAQALQSMVWSDKARALVKALALAPNRALSRLEMARAIGSDSVNATNSVLGHFAKALALELDPDIEAAWKPEDGPSRGDWVFFACVQGTRIAARSEDEPDDWVFVMREGLALALDTIGHATYREISEVAADALWPDNDEVSEDDDDDAVKGPYEDPMDDIDAADAGGELEDLSETERKSVISARVGQGVYREALLELWQRRCAVTGTCTTEAIVASHIKPWAVCTNAERLDAANGLPLVGTLDRLFDCGLISFDASGGIIISPRLPAAEYPRLHLTSEIRLRSLPEDTAAYLVYHREMCFLADATDESDEELAP